MVLLSSREWLNYSDEKGNLLSDGTNTYTYDAANRLLTVRTGGQTITYTYNGAGDRVSQTVNGVTRSYVLDLNAGLTQVLGDGDTTYLYGNGRVVQMEAGELYYFFGDVLGSVRQMVRGDSSGDVVRNYTPYGEVLNSLGTAKKDYAFTGEAYDNDNKLLYLRAHYYNSYLGQFM